MLPYLPAHTYSTIFGLGPCTLIQKELDHAEVAGDAGPDEGGTATLQGRYFPFTSY